LSADPHRTERIQIALIHPDLFDADLAQILSARPVLADLDICTKIAHHASFGPTAAGELGILWSSTTGLYERTDDFAKANKDVPLAACAVLMSSHWWFKEPSEPGHHSNMGTFIDLVQRIAAHGTTAVELAHTLCKDVELELKLIPHSNQPCFNSLLAVEVVYQTKYPTPLARA
jgi:hypothetical protein